jgi:hypothetical protein
LTGSSEAMRRTLKSEIVLLANPSPSSVNEI